MAFPPNTVFVTRGLNPEVLFKSQRLIQPTRLPVRVISNVEAVEYFDHVLRLNADWAINLDEDVFLARCDYLASLVGYMAENDYSFCGMPDGTGWFRSRYDNNVPNVFFNVLHLARIRGLGDLQQIMAVGEQFMCDHGIEDWEPYYPLFYGLLAGGLRFLPLKVTDHLLRPRSGPEDPQKPITVLYDHRDRAMLIHAWYSREFRNGGEAAERIKNAYRTAVKLSQTDSIDLPLV